MELTSSKYPIIHTISRTSVDQNNDDSSKLVLEKEVSNNTTNCSFKCKKKPWSVQEDKLLIKLVHQYGAQKWTKISEYFPERIGKQCRERWHNHLNPDINKSQWSQYEEWVLFLSHKLYGNQWAIISRSLSGRTDNNIKNHWNSNMKKKLKELQNRLQQIENQMNSNQNVQMSRLEQQLIESIIKGGLMQNQMNLLISRGRKPKKVTRQKLIRSECESECKTEHVVQTVKIKRQKNIIIQTPACSEQNQICMKLSQDSIKKVKKDINVVPASRINFEMKTNLFGPSSSFSTFLGKKSLINLSQLCNDKLI